MKTKETTKKETKVKISLNVKHPAFVSDTQKPKKSIITCGTCHCSGSNYPT